MEHRAGPVDIALLLEFQTHRVDKLALFGPHGENVFSERIYGDIENLRFQ